MKQKGVKTGLDVLVQNKFKALRGARVGVICHPASISSELHHVVDLLVASKACDIKRLFAPEHGFRGAAQDMVTVTDSIDAKTNLPVVSLYGNSFQSLIPQDEMIADLDILVVDLQDVGSRYYTFTQTLALAMEVCGRHNVRVLVLDRPNPINGRDIEGALLTLSCRSFCGMHPVANRHGLTIGEFAKIVSAGFGEGENRTPAVNCSLEIIEMESWKRKMYFRETGLPWVLPSPNMPTEDTALVYPGTCLFEGTNLSEGRGTTRPFEIVGAPFIEPELWIDATLSQGIELEGFTLRPLGFIPQFQKWHGKSCGGVQIHVTDPKTFRPMRLGLALIAAAQQIAEEFSWRQETYEFVENVQAIDLLFGSFEFRRAVETKQPLEELLPAIEQFEKWYKKILMPFLLYD